jgi:DnaJ-class molecular chaperone
VEKNYYSVLGVSRTADSAAIHRAFRSQARRYHPDSGIASSPDRFRDAVEAYETLRDPVRRRQHDTNLGIATSEGISAAEPLFAPRYPTGAKRGSFPHSHLTFEDLFDEIIRFIDAEFRAPLRFF